VRLIGTGILLVVVVESAAMVFRDGGSFFAPYDFGEAMGLAPYLPYGFALSTSFVFEVGIFLTVLGSSSMLIDTLGNPAILDEDIRFSLEESSPLVIESDPEDSTEDVEKSQSTEVAT